MDWVRRSDDKRHRHEERHWGAVSAEFRDALTERYSRLGIDYVSVRENTDVDRARWPEVVTVGLRDANGRFEFFDAKVFPSEFNVDVALDRFHDQVLVPEFGQAIADLFREEEVELDLETQTQNQ